MSEASAVVVKFESRSLQRSLTWLLVATALVMRDVSLPIFEFTSEPIALAQTADAMSEMSEAPRVAVVAAIAERRSDRVDAFNWTPVVVMSDWMSENRLVSALSRSERADWLRSALEAPTTAAL